MLNLPNNILVAANSLVQDSPWLILLDIQVESEPVMRIVNNTDDVSFGGNTYTAFAFTINQPKQSSKGEIPSVQLQVANATRTLQTYLEEYNGGVGASVTIRIVNAGHLTEDYAELTTTMTVIAAKATAQWVTWTLSAVNPLNRKFPSCQYIATSCRFKFKGVHCGYAGAETACSRTLNRCQQLGNSSRFGGFPGLDGRGLRLV